MRNLGSLLLVCALVLTACGNPASAQSSSSTSQKTIEDIGSDTIVNLALAWLKPIRKSIRYTHLVSGGGSGKHVRLSTDDRHCQCRPQDQGRKPTPKNGIETHEIEIARDTIGVINCENPVQQ
jgi:ABC-type phosphate transport system substrate-binding protein